VLPMASRVVLVGNKISPGNPTVKPDGTVVRTLWGELAWQLGGKKAFARIQADDEKATSPGDALREMFVEYGPCLILIDEWVAYARQLHDQSDLPAGGFETQFSFAQVLTESAKAAVVVPDNVLFEGGAGEVVRRKLLHECDVHTLLRLPTGLFYAQGVKANVIFFDRKPASETPWTKQLWIYDLRTNMDFTLKTNPLARENLDEFVACYHPENRHDRTPTWSAEKPDDRWRSFTYDELVARDKVNLDIFWLRDESLEDSANLPEPDVLAAEIVEDLQAALSQFEGIAGELGEEED